MKRRTFLSTTGIAGVAGLAGCSELTSSGDDDGNGENGDNSDENIDDDGETSVTQTDSPGAVIESFYEAFAESQRTRIELTHSAALSERDQFELQNVETTVVEEGLSREAFASRVSLDTETVGTIVDGSETAIVEATVSVLEGGQQEESTGTFALATEDGAWKLVEQGVGGTEESSSAAPSVAFSFDYRSGENVVTITHDSGDSVQAQELFVRGDRIASGYTGAWHEIEGSGYGPEDEITAGMSLAVEVQGGDFEIAVIWQSQSGDNSATLATMDGPDA